MAWPVPAPAAAGAAATGAGGGGSGAAAMGAGAGGTYNLTPRWKPRRNCMPIASLPLSAAALKVGTVAVIEPIGEAGAERQAVRVLPREAHRRDDVRAELGKERRRGAVNAGERPCRGRHPVVERHLPIHLGRQAQVRAGAKGGAQAPAQPVRQAEGRRVPTERNAAEAGELDAAADFLADDRVGEVVPLTGPGAALAIGGRHLDRPAQREREWLIQTLGEQVDLRTKEHVSKVVARPGLAHEGILVHQSAVGLEPGRTRDWYHDRCA